MARAKVDKVKIWRWKCGSSSKTLYGRSVIVKAGFTDKGRLTRNQNRFSLLYSRLKFGLRIINSSLKDLLKSVNRALIAFLYLTS